MYEGKGWAGDVVLVSRVESGNDPFGKRGLARSKFAGEKDQHRGLEATGEFPAPAYGFLGGMGDDFLRHWSGSPGQGSRAPLEERWQFPLPRRPIDPQPGQACP